MDESSDHTTKERKESIDGMDMLVRLEQRSEGPLHSQQGTFFSYRYGYARSADSQRDDEPGQDYLVFRDLGERFVFSACDGVSQSFYGNLAARFLGDELIKLLAEEAPTVIDADELVTWLEVLLNELTAPATELVNDQPIPADPPLLREVLLEKQERGSETMFVCCRLDRSGEDFPDGRIMLAWMGDMRVNLWRSDGQVDLGGNHETEQRWSTSQGLIGGSVNVYCAPLKYSGEEVTHLVVYSDGLSELDPVVDQRHSDELLQETILATKTQPDSDDVTYFEVNWSVLDEEALFAPDQLVEETEEEKAPEPDSVEHEPEPIPAPVVPEPSKGSRRWLVFILVGVVIGFLCGILWMWFGLYPSGLEKPDLTIEPTPIVVATPEEADEVSSQPSYLLPTRGEIYDKTNMSIAAPTDFPQEMTNLVQSE